MAHAWCFTYAAAAAKSLQSCLTLHDPIDGSPPGPAIPGILQARTLEWVAISFSNACKWEVKVESLSRVRLLATPWTAAYQAPWSTGFSRHEYWSGVPLPSEPISNSFGDLDTYQDTIPHNQDDLKRSTAKNLMPITPFQSRSWQASSLKYLAQIVNILSFAGHKFSFSMTTQLIHWSRKQPWTIDKKISMTTFQ